MAVTRDTLVALPTTDNVDSYSSGGFTPEVGDLLVVFALVSGSVAAASCTSTGMTFSLVGTTTKANGGDTIVAFIANQLISAATARSVNVNVTGDNGTGAAIFVLALQEVDGVGADALAQAAAVATGLAANTPVLTFGAPVTAGNAVLSFIANASDPIGITTPANFTAVTPISYATPTESAVFAERLTGHSGTTVTWGSSGTQWGAIALEFNASATNVGPTADAGADQDVAAYDEVTLTGGGTDSDGTIVDHAWTQTDGSPTVTLSGTGTDPRTFTAPATVDGTTLTFELTVTDDNDAEDTDTVVVTVAAHDRFVVAPDGITRLGVRRYRVT